jgi:hypothetical protein
VSGDDQECKRGTGVQQADYGSALGRGIKTEVVARAEGGDEPQRFGP